MPRADALLASGMVLSGQDSEVGPLVADETAPPVERVTPWYRSSAVFLRGLAAVVAVGACVGLLGVRRTEDHPLQAASPREEIEAFATKSCSGLDEAELNAFDSVEQMEAAGWSFSKDGGTWTPEFQFRGDLSNPETASGDDTCARPNPKSYWGWDYPGNGKITLTFHGTGHMLLNFGNAYWMGAVQAEFVSPSGERTLLTVAGPKMIDMLAQGDFTPGTRLELTERAPRGITVINKISFICPASMPALVEGSTAKSLGGADWDINTTYADCENYYVFKKGEKADIWGTSHHAIVDREKCAAGCALSYQGYQVVCAGFLYPVLRAAQGECFMVLAGKSKDWANTPLCDYDLSLWAFHRRAY